MEFRVEIRDRSFILLEILDREIMNLTWNYSRIGGCGSFSFNLPRNFCEEKYISGDFNIRIYRRSLSTKSYDLWFQGIVEHKIPTVRGDKEVISVQGHGYTAQLSRIYVDKDYTSQEVSAIVKDILDTYVVPNTDITYDAADIENTSFTADSLKFNTNAKRALQTCADIVGSREWGVNKDRKFFFKQRGSIVGFWYPLGGEKIEHFSSDDSFKDIVNRVIIQGGDVGGTPYTKIYDDTLSQLKYGRRDKVIQNSAITTDTVSQQYANAIFAEFNDVVRRARCNFIREEKLFEENMPISLFMMIARGITYGEKYYGIFLYSGRISYQINRINYSVDDVSTLRIRLNLGQPRPSVAENIAQLEHELEQLRTAGV